MKPNVVKKKPPTLNNVSTKSKVIQKTKPVDSGDMDCVVFVGNAIASNAMKKVKKTFSEFGSIQAIWFRNHLGTEAKMSKMLHRKFVKEGREKALDVGNFYVRYKSKDDAEKAIEQMNMKEVDWKEGLLNVTSSEKKNFKRNSIHLRNLPADFTEKTLMELCAKHDITGIKNIRLIRDSETGQCTGKGFVQFETGEACETAIDKRSFKLNGERIYIHKVLGKEKLGDLKNHLEKEKDKAVKQRLSDILVLKDDKKPKKFGKKMKKKGKKKSIMT